MHPIREEILAFIIVVTMNLNGAVSTSTHKSCAFSFIRTGNSIWCFNFVFLQLFESYFVMYIVKVWRQYNGLVGKRGLITLFMSPWIRFVCKRGFMFLKQRFR